MGQLLGMNYQAKLGSTHKEEKILLAHGSGGELSHELISTFFLNAFTNPYLDPLDDMAILQVGESRLAFTTDSS